MESLSALLSQVLVAFTIEFDNESEHRTPHRTTRFTSGEGPWLVSMAMWLNCLRYVGEEPISLKELERLARTKTNLHGMQRWGHITVELNPPKLIRATPKGLQARDACAPLFAVVEKRWEERFDKDAVDRLRAALWPFVSQFDLDLPDCLPILGFGLFSAGPDRKRQGTVERDLPLATLLSRVLLSFAMAFERDSDLSLANCANVVRVLNQNGVLVRDLPLWSGVSKEAIAMAMGVLRKLRLALIEPDPAGRRLKIARLTAKGVEAQDAYLRRLALIEGMWQERYGDEAVRALRDALAPFTCEALLRGMEPYPDGWRASVRRPTLLPHFPMVLHRGGYPDGS